MSPEQQRICIAKACGWLKIHNANTMAACGIWVGYDPKNAIVGKPQELPDFLNDLNAMHEAEKVVTEDSSENYIKFSQYLHHLESVILRDKGESYMPEVDSWSGYIAFATAAQRAEAFLRCIGKWKD